MSNCKRCGAPMVWVKTEKGKNMPLDPESTEAGKFVPVIMATMGDGVRKAVPIAKPEDGCLVMYMPGSSRPRYTSHFQTCPNAAEFSRAARKGESDGGRA